MNCHGEPEKKKVTWKFEYLKDYAINKTGTIIQSSKIV